jgi:uncharacterized protein YraI
MALVLLATAGCGSLGSPVEITDRPLSERIEERNDAPAEQNETELVAEALTAPEAIAFSDALASGNFLRLQVQTNGIDTSLRAGPGSGYDELTTLTDGVEVLATGNQTGEWVYVFYGDFEGWVSNRRLEIGAAPEDVAIEADEVDTTPVVYVVSGETIGVNMRAEPNVDAELVSGAPLGSEVTGTGETDGHWIEVTFNEVTGWASGNYLVPKGLESAAPAEPQASEPTQVDE